MKIGIIGGGALGLALAKILDVKKISYELFERSLVGRKILASGNGKANIGNINVYNDCYNDSFGYELVKDYHKQLMIFFKEIGLVTKLDEEGRIYPYSESSQSVLNCLMPNPKNIIENFPINSISQINGKYYLNDVRGPFDYLVICTGSKASFIKKKQDGFNSYLSYLNLSMKEDYPSLVGFKLESNFNKLNGVRVKCNAKLIKDDRVLYSEAGEAIIKADGISGICIMNLSSRYARLSDKSNCYISLDLIPDLDITIFDKKQLVGLFNPKLVDYLNNYSVSEINKLIKDFKFKITGVYDYEFAQVVSGGITLDNIDKDLRLKNHPNIFVGGEVLDIDGVCGGYNLMFAFSCALKIGDVLCNIK